VLSLFCTGYQESKLACLCYLVNSICLIILHVPQLRLYCHDLLPITQVRDKLLDACRRLGVEVRFDASLEGLDKLSRSSSSSSSNNSGSMSITDGRNSDCNAPARNGSVGGSNRREGAGRDDSEDESRCTSRSSMSEDELGAKDSSSMDKNASKHRWLCRLGGEGGELEADKLVRPAVRLPVIVCDPALSCASPVWCAKN